MKRTGLYPKEYVTLN